MKKHLDNKKMGERRLRYSSKSQRRPAGDPPGAPSACLHSRSQRGVLRISPALSSYRDMFREGSSLRLYGVTWRPPLSPGGGKCTEQRKTVSAGIVLPLSSGAPISDLLFPSVELGVRTLLACFHDGEEITVTRAAFNWLACQHLE